MERRYWLVGGAGLAAGALLAGGIAVAASRPPASNAQGTVCVTRNGGMRFVAPAASCARGERRSTVGWTARGAWSASARYLPGSIVLRPSGSYVALTTTKGKVPEGSPLAWRLVAATSAGPQGPVGPPGPTGPTGPSGQQGQAGPAGVVDAYTAFGAGGTVAGGSNGVTYNPVQRTLPAGNYLLSGTVAGHPSTGTGGISCAFVKTGAGGAYLGASTYLDLPTTLKGGTLPVEADASLATTSTVALSCIVTGTVVVGPASLHAISVQTIH